MQKQNFTIESAHLGDERGRVNVTSVVKEKVSSDGSYKVPVNSSLLPYVMFGEKIELTKDEENTAYEKAVKQCGSANDNKCVQAKTAQFKRERLEEKEFESQSTSNMIKGRRLTVVINQNGEKKTMEVPDGGTFEFGNKGPQVPSVDVRKPLITMMTLSSATLEMIKYVSIFMGSLLYVLSIFITFTAFKNAGFGFKTYILTAIAAFVPYSGYVITFLYFAVRTLIQNMPAPT